MTDNEIIKALGLCVYGDYAKCHYECPYKRNCSHLTKDALSLINSQKVENEHLQDLLVKANAEIAKQETEIENYIKVAETQQCLSMERFFEIERLSKRLEKRTTELDRLTIYFDKAVEEKLKTAKAEAVKELAAELHKRVADVGVHGAIDCVVKEMID